MLIVVKGGGQIGVTGHIKQSNQVVFYYFQTAVVGKRHVYLEGYSLIEQVVFVLQKNLGQNT